MARWQRAVGLLGLAGLAVAAWTTTRAAGEQALPGLPAVAGGLAVQIVALLLGARAWICLFPPTANRAALARGVYVSQLTKYLPAGGFVQTASQVTLSSGEGGVAVAAVRLPVFGLCYVVAGATCGSLLAVNDDLPPWARLAAALGLVTVAALDRRLSATVLRLARRLVPRLPEPDALPPQGAIWRCYACALGNMVAIATVFVILLGDLATVEPLAAGAALGAGWAIGYLVLPLPGGLGVREAVLVAALPGVPAGSLLAASVAHRLLGLVAEAVLAGSAHLRLRATRRHHPD